MTDEEQSSQREQEYKQYHAVTYQKIMWVNTGWRSTGKYILLSFNHLGMVINQQEIDEPVATYLLANGTPKLT